MGIVNPNSKAPNFLEIVNKGKNFVIEIH